MTKEILCAYGVDVDAVGFLTGALQIPLPFKRNLKLWRGGALRRIM